MKMHNRLWKLEAESRRQWQQAQMPAPKRASNNAPIPNTGAEPNRPYAIRQPATDQNITTEMHPARASSPHASSLALAHSSQPGIDAWEQKNRQAFRQLVNQHQESARVDADSAASVALSGATSLNRSPYQALADKLRGSPDDSKAKPLPSSTRSNTAGTAKSLSIAPDLGGTRRSDTDLDASAIEPHWRPPRSAQEFRPPASYRNEPNKGRSYPPTALDPRTFRLPAPHNMPTPPPRRRDNRYDERSSWQMPVRNQQQEAFYRSLARKLADDDKSVALVQPAKPLSTASSSNPKPAIPLQLPKHTIHADSDYIAPNTTTHITVCDARVGILYCLRRHDDNSLVGSPQSVAANGSALVWGSPPIQQNTRFNILAIEVNSGRSVQLPDLVRLNLLYPVNSTLAAGQQTLIVLHEAQAGTQYSLRQTDTQARIEAADPNELMARLNTEERTQIGTAVIGTGNLELECQAGHRYFQSPLLEQSTSFSLHASSTDETPVFGSFEIAVGAA